MWPSRRTGETTPPEMEEDSDDEAFHGAESPVDLLLFSSIDSYDAVQSTSTMDPLPCDCTEVLSTEMASTSCAEPATAPYPHMLYYPVPPEPTSTPERNIVSSPNRQNNDADHTDDESDFSTSEDDLASVSTEIIYEADLNPIFLKRASRLLMPWNSGKNMPKPEATLDRRRCRAGHRMAAATRLDSQVANRVIKYARCVINAYERHMGCLNCGLLPLCPITGQCGHTRCTDCVVDQTRCPCGDEAPEEVFVNILIRDLVRMTTSEAQSLRSFRIVPVPASLNMNAKDNDVSSADRAAIKPQPMSGAGGPCRGHMRFAARTQMRARIPMSPRARYNHGVDLLRVGQHLEAVPYLAFAAASGQPELQRARTLLSQAINVLSNKRDPRRLASQLIRSVRRLSPTSWIRTTDLECILCCDTFTNPVTTPCGHMFCRTCLEKTLDYRKRCPLCLRNLIGFTFAETGNTFFVQAVLKSININVAAPPLEPDLIHIFVCTVAYPSVPCPLFIFDPRYWLMIRRVLESGSRRFGMIAFDRGQDYVHYGTILEVRDCVHLEDGRSILSTMGLSRFKVIERGVRDGCEVARILPITDVIPRDVHEVCDVRNMGQRIFFKALLWLSRLNAKVLADIEAAFGVMQPRGFLDDPWWESTDGPSWVWWLVAVLPLRSEIKILILSTNSLIKRMMAVARVLEAVIQNPPITFPSQYRLQSTLPADESQIVDHDGA